MGANHGRAASMRPDLSSLREGGDSRCEQVSTLIACSVNEVGVQQRRKGRSERRKLFLNTVLLLEEPVSSSHNRVILLQGQGGSNFSCSLVSGIYLSE